MHVALVTHGLPHPSSNGGPITCWAIAEALLRAKHRVTVVALAYPWDDFNTVERRAAVLELGAKLFQVETSAVKECSTDTQNYFTSKITQMIRFCFRPELSSFFPTVNLAPRMKRVLRDVAPDVMFVYHWDSLAAIHGLNLAPRMVGVGDPWHLPNLRRWQQAVPKPTRSYLLWTLGTLRDSYNCPKFMVELLNECEASGCFQAREAEWFRRNGATRCTYFRSPVVDTDGADWQKLRNAMPKRSKPKILLGPSNLNSTSTSAGIRLFAKEILPRLEHELGPEGFEVHVVGEGELPVELAKMLPRPSVKLRGRIEPPDSEFLSADIQLVPTPFVLGIRLRVIVGFSFGCCVVAHTNEAVNLPEMVNGKNALLASNGKGLAGAIIRAVRDPAMRNRLGLNARQTYEHYFAPEVAAVPIVTELERLSHERKYSKSETERPLC